ncbi:hypothetical protein E2C01_081933 [Portunus trituberculatus]|uniref:Uncharacterized protein n=1 Tax=Portunus trituberculatus TaxID=210409 RepID=A0A5B7IXX9_PORTR|nr:hypothetical protein [Portunus trituberculatus]
MDTQNEGRTSYDIRS